MSPDKHVNNYCLRTVDGAVGRPFRSACAQPKTAERRWWADTPVKVTNIRQANSCSGPFNPQVRRSIMVPVATISVLAAGTHTEWSS